MNKKELIKEVNGFLDKLKVKLNIQIEAGKSYIINVDYLIPDLKNVSFQNGKILPKLIDYIEIQKKIIPKTIFKLAEKDILKNFPEYDKFFFFLKENYKLNDDKIHHLIDALYYLLLSYLYNKIDKKKFEEYIKSFIRELEGKFALWKIKVFLYGVWITDFEYKISNKIKIRKIKSSDFKFSNKSEFNKVFGFEKNYPYTVICIKFRPKSTEYIYSQSQAFREANLLLTLFRLFRLGSVFAYTYSFRYLSYLTYHFKMWSKYNEDLIKDHHIYMFKENDIRIFKELLKKATKHNFRKAIMPKRVEINHVFIALDMYNSAFLNITKFEGRGKNLESQLTYVSSCLEALYLRRGEDGAITRRLAQRVAIILKTFGFDPFLILQIVKKAYNVRSTYSHGSKLKLSDIGVKNLRNLSIMALECARISLLVFLQLYGRISKENLLQLIDQALLENKKYLELKELVMKNCIINL
ncbi:hypothetical protein LCGC14_0892880 [marine sediment metagenome]|uniref:Uncharacterized protein n=1 Tax=marine sediment metagenome TaxID=412755 RepID=A0A0F9NYQ1_9ZZZZ